MRNKVAVIGGGTYQPIRNHFGLCSFARGTVAKKLHSLFVNHELTTKRGLESSLYLSKMCHVDRADITDSVHLDAFHTNDDLEALINKLKESSETKMIVLTAAVCDFSDPYRRS